METGSVKWFNEASGYGFIAPDHGGSDLFVRGASLLGEDQPVALIAGERVEFESRVAGMGPEAIQVLRPRAERPRRLFSVLPRART
jgi:CspA family cold shock protein